MKICIFGAGNGGLAYAFDFTQAGHDVRLCDFEAYAKNLNDIKDIGGIRAEGELEGFVTPAYVGTDLETAITDAELIILCGPAYSTQPMAEAIRPYVNQGQLILVSPSSCAGAIVCKNALGVDLQDAAYPVAETSTLPYAVRVIDKAHIHVYLKLKGGLRMASLPESSLDSFMEIMGPLYPALEAVSSVWQTSLGNANPVIHPAVTLVNAARIEQTQGDFFFYEDGVSDAAGKLIQALDNERIAIGKALGIAIDTDPVVGVQQGYMAEDNYTTGYRNAPGFIGIRAQSSLENRYFTEDVGYGLVFLTDLAKTVGVETPVMDSVITIVSVLMSSNYKKEAARTVASLGFSTKEELLALTRS